MPKEPGSQRRRTSPDAAGRGRSGGAAGGRSATRGSSSALAAGAARASGERARRRQTPLLGDARAADAESGSAGGAAAPEGGPGSARSGPPDAAGAHVGSTIRDSAREPDERSEATASGATPSPGVHRPKPVARPVPSRRARRRAGTRTSERPSRSDIARRAASGAEDETRASPPRLSVVSAGDATETSVSPDLAEMLQVAIGAARVAGQSLGLTSEEIEQRIAEVLHLLRRRLTGDYEVDDFGFDRDFTDNVYLPLLRPLYQSWFRVEVRGIENIPSGSGALVVANHSGTIAVDALMTQVAVHDEHPRHPYLRMLGADLVFQLPVVGDIARKTGATLATNSDAERLLSAGELVGVWPEGFKGIGKPFSERYKLQRFGRGGFVAAALRTGVPIVPCSIVGAEEAYPMIGNMRTMARLLGLPYAPVTPTWPWLGPLGLIPLPSKWIIEFGAPVETASLGSAAAEDPMLVFDLADQIRETIQQTLYSLLMKRRSVFF